MKSMPKLQPPGAGLPFRQRVVLKLWIGPVVSKRTPRTECRETYERLTKKLIERVSSVPPELRSTKVLVDPIPGLEDSSRYWSLNGLLEHLLIVARGMESIILSLSAGRVPDGGVDIAKVKPGNQESDVFSEFMAYAPELMKRIDDKLSQPGMDFDSPLRLMHPWFGKITARQWYWLMSSHQAIHYRQAKEISQRLVGKVGALG